MESIFLIILQILSLIIIFWLSFPFFTSLLAYLKGYSSPKADAEVSDFACVITVYSNLDIAVPLVESLLQQKYTNYEIYLVADKVAVKDFPLSHPRLHVHYPEKPLNSKVMSIKRAMELFVRKHAFVAIFDPDNLAHPDFLSEINAFHKKGYKTVQGKRTAKNLDTAYAALDAMGEYYYDYTVRRVPFVLGSSSTIAGSGMSIESNIYKKNIEREVSQFHREGLVVSEDKSLQMELVDSGVRIAYANKAILFDEKVSTSDQVSRQRTRWLNSYFRHTLDVLVLLMKGIFSGSWNRTLFSLTILMPPMIILTGGSLMLILLNLIFQPVWACAIIGALLLFALTFMLALKLNRAPSEIWKAIPLIPLFVIRQILSLLKIRKANKDYMATSHSYFKGFDEVWEMRKKDFE
jgi:cellulose synthase/poly-beta-1,6-N-acetylglucosamine synthase-like glycosyltransferase